MDDEKYCSNCGNKLNPNSIFCDKCGQKVTSDEKNEKITCPYCQSNLQKDVAKCPNCGEWIDRNQKPFMQKIHKFINLFESNKKVIIASKICIYVTFIFAVFSRIMYALYDSIIHEYFIAENHSKYIGYYLADSYYSHTQTHTMDGFTQLIYEIGKVLFGHLTNTYEYAISEGLTPITNNIWSILFIISLIASILFIINKRNLKSYFYLILTIVSFLFMNYILWEFGTIPFKII